jgi:hypothetical protein
MAVATYWDRWVEGTRRKNWVAKSSGKVKVNFRVAILPYYHMESHSPYTYIRGTLFYVQTRNVTFNLPAELMRQAKIYAAEHNTTVNAVVRQLLEEKMSVEARARAAAERILHIAEHGACSSVDPGSVRREELYERW